MAYDRKQAGHHVAQADRPDYRLLIGRAEVVVGQARDFSVLDSARAATLKASMVQKSLRPAIEASELALLAITFLLMSLLFAVAHRVVQRPWSATISPPIPTTVSQSISLNPAESESARIVR